MGEAKRKREAMVNGYMACCGNCEYWRRNAPMNKQGVCFGNPPQALFMGWAQPAIAGVQPQPMVRFFRPETMDTDQKCPAYEQAKLPAIAAPEELPEIDLMKLNLEPAEGNAD